MKYVAMKQKSNSLIFLPRGNLVKEELAYFRKYQKVCRSSSSFEKIQQIFSEKFAHP